MYRGYRIEGKKQAGGRMETARHLCRTRSRRAELAEKLEAIVRQRPGPERSLRRLSGYVDGTASCRGGRRGASAAGCRAEAWKTLLYIGLERCVSLLRGRKISGLQSGAERSKGLLQCVAGLAGAAAVMVMMALRLAGTLLLRVLLDRGEVGLRGSEVARL